jgi:hypothetical protein
MGKESDKAGYPFSLREDKTEQKMQNNVGKEEYV